MAIFAPYLSFIWESIEDLGLSPERLFSEAGIDPSLRLDPNARISADQLDHVVWLAKQESHDDSFPFHLVEHLHPSFLGVMGYAWLTSSTLRKAFERMSRYQKLLADEGFIHLEDTEDFLRVVLDFRSYNLRDPDLREQMRLANAVKLCRMNYGDSFKPDKVFFMQEEPAKAASYYAFFRCELVFGAEMSELLINAETADRPLPGYNPQLEVLLEQQIVEYLAKLNKSDIAGRTKSMIFNQLPSGHVAIEEIAAKLCMSDRTLRRRLKDSGVSFKELLAETRRELGERYIQNSSLSLTEIAFMLGFSDSSSLSRAYKGWTGQSPSEYRSSQRGS
jgi:AraC-like DNA-binding protein